MKLVQLAQGFLDTKRCQTGCWVATPTLTHDLDHDFHDLQHNIVRLGWNTGFPKMKLSNS